MTRIKSVDVGSSMEDGALTWRKNKNYRHLMGNDNCCSCDYWRRRDLECCYV